MAELYLEIEKLRSEIYFENRMQERSCYDIFNIELKKIFKQFFDEFVDS